MHPDLTGYKRACAFRLLKMGRKNFFCFILRVLPGEGSIKYCTSYRGLATLGPGFRAGQFYPFPRCFPLSGGQIQIVVLSNQRTGDRNRLGFGSCYVYGNSPTAAHKFGGNRIFRRGGPLLRVSAVDHALPQRRGGAAGEFHGTAPGYRDQGEEAVKVGRRLFGFLGCCLGLFRLIFGRVNLGGPFLLYGLHLVSSGLLYLCDSPRQGNRSKIIYSFLHIRKGFPGLSRAVRGVFRISFGFVHFSLSSFFHSLLGGGNGGFRESLYSVVHRLFLLVNPFFDCLYFSFCGGYRFLIRRCALGRFSGRLSVFLDLFHQTFGRFQFFSYGLDLPGKFRLGFLHRLPVSGCGLLVLCCLLGVLPSLLRELLRFLNGFPGIAFQLVHTLLIRLQNRGEKAGNGIVHMQGFPHNHVGSIGQPYDFLFQVFR